MTSTAIERFIGDVPLQTLEDFAALGEIAWDIETSGLNCEKDRIATCQLANRAGHVLLIQIGQSVPVNLSRLLANPAVRKIFHFAVFDLSFMSLAWNTRPKNVACTKVCSKLLNPTAKDHSLKFLLAHYLGIEIDKSQRLSDWFTASLSAEQVEYAANDVAHLLQLYDVLTVHLEERSLDEFAIACFRHLPIRVALEIGHFGDVFTY